MKILILPFDMASKGVFTLDSLNKIEGIEAKGFFLNGDDVRKARTKHAEYHKVKSFLPNPFLWFLSNLRKMFKLYKLIKWADVVHWVWDSSYSWQFDIKYVSYLNKPGIIEWSGSDIRNRDTAERLNPYMKLIYLIEVMNMHILKH